MNDEKNTGLDCEVSQLDDGTWEVWTPDFNGACIGGGATRQAAIQNTIDTLVATGAQLLAGQVLENVTPKPDPQCDDCKWNWKHDTELGKFQHEAHCYMFRKRMPDCGMKESEKP